MRTTIPSSLTLKPLPLAVEVVTQADVVRAASASKKPEQIVFSTPYPNHTFEEIEQGAPETVAGDAFYSCLYCGAMFGGLPTPKPGDQLVDLLEAVTESFGVKAAGACKLCGGVCTPFIQKG